MEHKNEAHTNPNTLNTGEAGQYRKPKKIPAPRSWADFEDQARQYVEYVKQYGCMHTLAMGELRRMVQMYDDARYWDQRTDGQRNLYWDMVEALRGEVSPQEFRSFVDHYLPVPVKQAHMFDVISPEVR